MAKNKHNEDLPANEIPAPEAMSANEIALYERIDGLEEQLAQLRQEFAHHQHGRDGLEVNIPPEKEPETDRQPEGGEPQPNSDPKPDAQP